MLSWWRSSFSSTLISPTLRFIVKLFCCIFSCTSINFNSFAKAFEVEPKNAVPEINIHTTPIFQYAHYKKIVVNKKVEIDRHFPKKSVYLESLMHQLCRKHQKLTTNFLLSLMNRSLKTTSFFHNIWKAVIKNKCPNVCIHIEKIWPWFCRFFSRRTSEQTTPDVLLSLWNLSTCW